MRYQDRLRLREIYTFRCGYCGVSEMEVGAELTIDHFHPRSRGGSDDMDNLVYACHACNEFKGDHWEPDTVEHILHPLRDELGRHLAEELHGALVGLTPTGQFHIDRLRLNRPGLILRRREVAAQSDTQRRIAVIEQELRELRAIAEELLGRIPPDSRGTV